MGRLSKREIKEQRSLYNEILTGLTGHPYDVAERIDFIYENFNPAIAGNNITEGGVFFTPYGLAQDNAVFSPRSGHIVDVCAGIGILSYRLQQMDTNDKTIKSITCIELDEKFCEIGKRLLPQAKWICANVFDKGLWEDLVKDLPDKRFDLMVSNPPFGVDQNKNKVGWLNFQGERDLQVLELCLRYAKNGSFILPTGSVPFSYSGRPYYEDKPDRYSRKFKRFLKANCEEFKFTMQCDGIDTSIYKDEWKNMSGSIVTEVADISIYPYSLYCLEDSLRLAGKEDDEPLIRSRTGVEGH